MRMQLLAEQVECDMAFRKRVWKFEFKQQTNFIPSFYLKQASSTDLERLSNGKLLIFSDREATFVRLRSHATTPSTLVVACPNPDPRMSQ
jgi:hypothetical protein